MSAGALFKLALALLLFIGLIACAIVSWLRNRKREARRTTAIDQFRRIHSQAHTRRKRATGAVPKPEKSAREMSETLKASADTEGRKMAESLRNLIDS